jgi:hypothetical protein
MSYPKIQKTAVISVKTTPHTVWREEGTVTASREGKSECFAYDQGSKNHWEHLSECRRKAIRNVLLELHLTAENAVDDVVVVSTRPLARGRYMVTYQLCVG